MASKNPLRLSPGQLARPVPPATVRASQLVAVDGPTLTAFPMQALDAAAPGIGRLADNTSASANFPEPWNESNPLINFVGGGTVYRAGAIRLDNPSSAAITVDSVTVDLGRPGPVFQLWQNVVVPAGSHPHADAGRKLQHLARTS